MTGAFLGTPSWQRSRAPELLKFQAGLVAQPKTSGSFAGTFSGARGLEGA